MFLSDSDIDAIILTLKLASTVTFILLLLCTPLAYWLARTQSWLKAPVSALVAMPLILPPTVIGFYLLIAMGPNGPIGELSQSLGIGLLPFSFWGLVLGSLFYSLPFVVQPIQNAIEAIGTKPIEAAATLHSTPLSTFIYIVLPLAKPGFLSAAVLGFAHTVGEFGIVLMIGGNIPKETKVVSIQIYDNVEALNYTGAHTLSAVMLIFSLLVLLSLYTLQQQSKSAIFSVGR
ncbi:molybdate ABC transporter permease subunit [Glaciecola sp. MH2013]|uniref:molybdate ABC transporter permease subunit n=1 Tax=Glaciecola sp. MH2013 TaxID=2785524 RepID=UPI00189F7891|nr:molybdate ABC transporter permease subunit [Glaciecola sp. MH2013]MBF7073089.1 molybdate ABC transporter permease subunit [Glaciecola sp. MH2013]